MDRTTELKPCPFCGHTAKLYQDMCDFWFVQCMVCNSRTVSNSEREYVISRWNMRVDESKVKEEYKKPATLKFDFCRKDNKDEVCEYCVVNRHCEVYKEENDNDTK